MEQPALLLYPLDKILVHRRLPIPPSVYFVRLSGLTLRWHPFILCFSGFSLSKLTGMGGGGGSDVPSIYQTVQFP